MPFIDKFHEIENMLTHNNVDFNQYIQQFGQIEKIQARANGEQFIINDYIKGLILAQLSAQRPWGPIHNNLLVIQNIFFNYEPNEILAHNPNYFYENIRQNTLGNRRISFQMNALHHNINILQTIENEVGLNNFFNQNNFNNLATSLSNNGSPYKLIEIGETLVYEFLKNVGVDCIKPDVHLKRICSNNRLSFFDHEPTSPELVNYLSIQAVENNIKMAYIDNIIWLFCADDFGNICNANPNCNFCNLQNQCNYG